MFHALLLGLTCGGCRSNASADAPHASRSPARTNVQVGGGPAAPQTPLDVFTAAETCPSRLQDVSEAMLLFWATYKRLPERLQQLRAVSDRGDKLELSCPETHKPFIYMPTGMRALGRKKALFIYDATPAPNGSRWCILAEDPRPGAAWSMEVIAIPDPIFRLYQLAEPSR